MINKLHKECITQKETLRILLIYKYTLIIHIQTQFSIHVKPK